MALLDRKFVSRYANPTFGIVVYTGGVPGAADDMPEVSMYVDGSSSALFTRDAVAGDDPGEYLATLTGADTANPGLYTVRFNYDVDSSPQIYGYDIEVGQSSPDYDALTGGWKVAVEDTWIKFADLFDSPLGGPNLQVYVQTHFGRNRLAQLMSEAMGRLNSASSPHAFYPVGGTDFPFDQYSGLLSQSLYISVVKHLIRSYVEQPEAVLGTAVTRLDRRDYMQRWQDVLNMEMAEFERDLGRYKMAALGMGGVHVLVAGGAFGNMGPTVNSVGPGAAAARGYWTMIRSH